eukprot:SAG31_NODE_5250_length_2650_cov_2.135241_2_plen_108_part_00
MSRFDEAGADKAEAVPLAAPRGERRRGGLFGVLRRRVPRIAVLQYALLSFYVQLEFDVFPLWTAAPVAAGGLGLQSAETGAMMSAMGAVQLVFSLFAFPLIHRCLCF